MLNDKASNENVVPDADESTKKFWGDIWTVSNEYIVK